MKFRIFKENSLNPDERRASTLSAAAAIYHHFFADGYSVRVIDVESGGEYAMRDKKLIAVPYHKAQHG